MRQERFVGLACLFGLVQSIQMDVAHQQLQPVGERIAVVGRQLRRQAFSELQGTAEIALAVGPFNVGVGLLRGSLHRDWR